MIDPNEVASLLHILEKTAGQAQFSNIHNAALSSLRQINDQHVEPEAEAQEGESDDSDPDEPAVARRL